MSTAPQTKPPKTDRNTCPFTIIVDTREQLAYTFEGITLPAHKGGGSIIVPTIRQALKDGDYSILGYPLVAVERKSKSDLYGSIGRRKNFEERLERMSSLREQGGYAAVVVEAHYDEVLRPPPFSKIHPRSISGTILAWRQRYAVDWHFYPDREFAERAVFRVLEMFYRRQASKHDS